MADDARKPILEDVDPSELGQLRPDYTPYVAQQQSQGREKGRSLGGEYRDVGRSTNLPEFTLGEWDDGLAAGRQRAEELHDAQRKSSGLLSQKEIRMERDDRAESDSKEPAAIKKERQLEREAEELKKELETEKGKDHER